MRRAVILALSIFLVASNARAAQLVLIEEHVLDFEGLTAGPVTDFFAAPFSDRDFRIDSGSISTATGSLGPFSGTQFALLANDVANFNDASWFFDVSSFGAAIDGMAFAVEFSFRLDTDNPLPSTGNILIRTNAPDLTPPITFGTPGFDTSTTTVDLDFDSTSGYQLFSLLRDDLPVGTRSLQVNAGVGINSGAPGSNYALDDFVVRFYRVRPAPEPGTAAMLGLGLAGLGALRRRRRARV